MNTLNIRYNQPSFFPTFESLDKTPIGRDFKICSTWQNKVDSYSKLKTWFPIVRLESNSALFIPDSHKPPQSGAGESIEIHSIKRPAAAVCEESLCFAFMVFGNLSSYDWAREIGCIIWVQFSGTNFPWRESS